MVFLCGRPGCGRESSATLQIDAPASTVTLVDPRVSRDGVPLCPHHADRTTPPMGWTMNDLRSRNRTLAPVRSIGPRTGEIVASPRPRAVGNPLFQDSRTEAEAEKAAERAAERLRAAARGDELDDDGGDGFSFPVTQEVRRMPVSASRTEIEDEPVAEPAVDSVEPAPIPGNGSGNGTTEAARTAGRRGGWAAAITAGAGAPALNASGPSASNRPKAPASRPSKRRDVVEETPEPEEEKFPWHFSFKGDDNEQPQELKAKTPLLARAFRSSVG